MERLRRKQRRQLSLLALEDLRYRLSDAAGAKGDKEPASSTGRGGLEQEP